MMLLYRCNQWVSRRRRSNLRCHNQGISNFVLYLVSHLRQIPLKLGTNLRKIYHNICKSTVLSHLDKEQQLIEEFIEPKQIKLSTLSKKFTKANMLTSGLDQISPGLSPLIGIYCIAQKISRIFLHCTNFIREEPKKLSLPRFCLKQFVIKVSEHTEEFRTA